MLYIGSNKDRVLRAKLLLFAQMCEEPAFNQLRTKEQLGYVVFSGATINNDWMGFRVLIQSEKDCHYLEKRIDVWLEETIAKHMEEVTEAQFERFKISIINKRLERLKNLSQETARLWTHIMTECYDFEQNEHDANAILPLTKPDLLSFFKTHIYPSSPHRARLSVHLIAQASPATIAAQTTPGQQTDEAMALIVQFLATHGIVAQPEKLMKRFKGVDVAGGDALAMVRALTGYLVEDEKVAEDKVRAVVEQGQAMMARALPAVGIDVGHDASEANGTADGAAGTESNGHVDEEAKLEGERDMVKIKDVRAWKAGLACTAGPVPVVDLSFFEEGAAKL
ncbi:hypothetical protein LTS18_006535 [Coniosporium uncinatum]|uniref:Uncharacterized protein n=1 Tax=Coniosporium uncinatum TaxID=93489 RepID=A0ACC3D3V4_9PEZI|nr:hypothetical protein LTS18_006535 [Coniosporium uncinatum]